MSQLRAVALQRPWLRPALRCGGRILRYAGLQVPRVAGAVNAGAYARWIAEQDTLTEPDRAAIRAHVARLRRRPLISVVMPAYNTPEALLREAIASVRAQLYPDWELCVADDASPAPHVAAVLSEAAAADPRIRWVRREANGHIAAATNSALALASGEFVALMDHDDLLPEQALYRVALVLESHPDADLIYSDEDKIDAGGRRFDPYFKPDWSPDLMLGHNLVSHLGVYRRALLERLGGMREGFEGSQDYDLALRVARATTGGRIHHIPAVLYHWRQEEKPASFSQTQMERCVAAARTAIAEHVAAGGVQGAEILPLFAAPFWSRVRWPLPQPAPRVSLVLQPRGEAEELERCVTALLERTRYPEMELVLAQAGGPAELPPWLARLRADPRVRMPDLPKAGSRSALWNAAVRAAGGEVVVLLDGAVEPIDGDWLREMVSLALRPDVGAVGAKLLNPDNTQRQAGLALGVREGPASPGIAGSLGRGAHRTDAGYLGHLALTREVSAVAGACLAVRRSTYEAMGGLDAAGLPDAFADVDLCLRLQSHGLRVLWTPFAELYQLDPAPEPSPEAAAEAARAAERMRARWGDAVTADRFYNPAFGRDGRLFQLDGAPQARPWRVPRH